MDTFITVVDGEDLGNSFCINTHCVKSVKEKVLLLLLKWLTTLSLMKVMKGCSGMRAIGRVYAKAVMIGRPLRKTADGERKEESTLIKVTNNDVLITCGQSVDNSSRKGRGVYFLTT